MWFTEVDGNQIGRITPTGGITEFTLSGAHTGLFGITSGPKGDLWFTETDKSRIGEITPAGIVVSFTTVGSRPLGITPGPDGNLWFVEQIANEIGRLKVSQPWPNDRASVSG